MESSPSSSKQKHEFLDRTSRATRGKRMTRLLDDEVEEDELFWNQDALKEEEHDVEYEEEGDAVDVFDSDFDEDEQEPDAEEAEKEPEERKRKKLSYPGNPSLKKKKNKVISKSVVAAETEEVPEESKHAEHHGVLEDVQEEKIVRKSTRTSVVVRQAEREAIREAVQATARPIKRKKGGEEKKMTQEVMLLEAAQTEIMNLRNLERVLAREEEVKKRAIVHKAVYSGPQIRHLSRNGDSFLEFINGSSFESDISTTSTPYPAKALCAVAGLPANYRDPKTGLPYANKEAFKIIREQFAKENNGCSKQEKNAEILPSEPGFSKKGKRSVIPRNHVEPSNVRRMARFRRIPALEIEISD